MRTPEKKQKGFSHRGNPQTPISWPAKPWATWQGDRQGWVQPLTQEPTCKSGRAGHLMASLLTDPFPYSQLVTKANECQWPQTV